MVIVVVHCIYFKPLKLLNCTAKGLGTFNFSNVTNIWTQFRRLLFNNFLSPENGIILFLLSAIGCTYKLLRTHTLSLSNSHTHSLSFNLLHNKQNTHTRATFGFFTACLCIRKFGRVYEIERKEHNFFTTNVCSHYPLLYCSTNFRWRLNNNSNSNNVDATAITTSTQMAF